MVETSIYALLAIATALFGVVMSHLFNALQVKTGLTSSSYNSAPRAKKTAAMLGLLILGIVVWLCAAHISPHVVELIKIFNGTASNYWLGLFCDWKIYNDLLSSLVLIFLLYIIVRMTLIGTSGVDFT